MRAGGGMKTSQTTCLRSVLNITPMKNKLPLVLSVLSVLALLSGGCAGTLGGTALGLSGTVLKGGTLIGGSVTVASNTVSVGGSYAQGTNAAYSGSVTVNK